MGLMLTDAIVLQCFPYAETSRIVRLLTREAGVQSVIARGATRPRSRYAVLEPFSEGTASIHIRPTRELQTLGAFDLLRGRQPLGRDLLRFGGASLLAELVLRTASEEAQRGLFDAVSEGLDRLMAADPAIVECTLLAAVWRVISVLGFQPSLDDCIVCDTPIDRGIAASFDYAAGGLRCEACAAGMPGRRIPVHARAALAAFCLGETVDVAVTEGHWRLLSRYLDHHLLEGAPLRSLHFLATSLSTG